MDKKKVRKWVRALESGKYKQARGVLYDGDGYCCLGVACAVVAGDPNPEGSYLVGNSEWDNLSEDLFGDIDSGGVLGSHSKKESQLISLNDNGKKDFYYIARWIRKNILGEDVIIDVDAYNRRRGFKKGTK